MIAFSKKVLLAPLAGISNPVFRQVNKCLGADIVFSEMVSADGTVRNNKKTELFIRCTEKERPFGIQLFGSGPAVMADAARFVEEFAHPDLIDLNFGCPVKKVVRRNGGSALLQDPELLGKIVRAVVDSVTTPVTVKIRAGWKEINAPEISRRIEANGAAAITIHARTQAQGFSGKADWNIIKEVKRSVNIPVIGNGDIFTGSDALRMFEMTRCDACMLARGVFGNPWLFAEIKATLSGKSYTPPNGAEKVRVSLDHLDRMIAEYGLRKGVYDMRKHFAWYLKGIPNAASVRKKIFLEDDPVAVKKIVTDFFLSVPDSEMRHVMAFDESDN
jgi:nifR3 family TIM-barrel protein